ncbi:hypothetical protein [Chryseotalea sanaruensis]|uniref:hypothetical protein n=1 Tax=Chryseotalea sanaruensis TaxID=2482724 RepID=UPI0011D07B61|nr:hypothetical protein [Chryseotalea sanaruensis]
MTTIDVLGSISSRKLNYKYVYLTPISFLVYFWLGYRGHSISTLPWTLIIVCLTGIYDGTIGWKLSIILKANFADKEEYTKTLSLTSRISGMLVMSGIFGLLGFVTAGYI